MVLDIYNFNYYQLSKKLTIYFGAQIQQYYMLTVNYKVKEFFIYTTDQITNGI